jgi:hypothetical protein
MSWLEQQGPWCPALIEYLNRNHRQYEALIFFTYLYAPTVLGLEIDPSRSILVPTAHDEPAIKLSIYKGHVQESGGGRVQHRGRKEFPHRRRSSSGAWPRRRWGAAST